MPTPDVNRSVAVSASLVDPGRVCLLALALLAGFATLAPRIAPAATRNPFPSTFVPVNSPRPASWSAAWDLNGDGEVDLVRVENTPDYHYLLVTLLGRGDGTFGDSLSYPLPDYAAVAGVADFDGDGRMDIVLGFPGSFGVWRSLANGTLASPQYTSTATPYSLAIGDVNGDGHADVVLGMMASAPHGLATFPGNGNGTFAAPVVTTFSYFSYGLALADVNRDGKLDALAPESYYGAIVHELRGRGDGTFVEHTPQWNVAYWPIGMAAADLNGDGRDDFAAGGAPPTGMVGTPYTTVQLSTGDSLFTGTTYYMGGASRALRFADIDGDGRLDLVALNQNSHLAGVRYGTGGGAFGALQLLQGPEYGVASADVNHDGRLDVVFETGVLPQVATRVFGDHNAYACGSAAIAVATGDLDGDGIPDVAVANREPGTVSVMLGRPGLRLAAPTALAMGAAPWDVKLADLNADGHLDLVTASHNANALEVRLGNGDGSFGALAGYWLGAPPSSVDIGDLDGDGVPDLVATLDQPYASPGNLVVVRGLGGGSFAAAVNYADGLSRERVVLGDLNEDGHLDAVTAGDLGTTRSLGTGTAAFGAPTTLTGEADQDIALADLDGDHHLDLVLVGGTRTGVMRGHGDGTFDPVQEYWTIAPQSAIAVADLDGDGRLDLVSVLGSPSFSPETVDLISVRLGNGDGTFGDDARFGSEFGPHDVAIADFDGDGRPELVVANFLAQTVSLLRNRSALVGVPVARPGDGAVALRVAPNPVASGMTVRFTLERAGRARLVIRDVQGRTVAAPLDRVLPAGAQTASWDVRDDAGRRVRPGVYFAELRAGAALRTQRIVVVE